MRSESEQSEGRTTHRGRVDRTPQRRRARRGLVLAVVAGAAALAAASWPHDAATGAAAVSQQQRAAGRPVASSAMSALSPSDVLPPRVLLDGAYARDITLTTTQPTLYTFLVPSGYYGMLIWFSVVAQTDATVLNRSVRLQVSEPKFGGASGTYTVSAPALLTASQTVPILFATDVATVAPGSGAAMTVQIPRTPMPPGTEYDVIFSTGAGGDLLQTGASLRIALFPTGGAPPAGFPAAQPVAPAPLQVGG